MLFILNFQIFQNGQVLCSEPVQNMGLKILVRKMSTGFSFSTKLKLIRLNAPPAPALGQSQVNHRDSGRHQALCVCSVLSYTRPCLAVRRPLRGKHEKFFFSPLFLFYLVLSYTSHVQKNAESINTICRKVTRRTPCPLPRMEYSGASRVPFYSHSPASSPLQPTRNIWGAWGKSVKHSPTHRMSIYL